MSVASLTKSGIRSLLDRGVKGTAIRVKEYLSGEDDSKAEPFKVFGDVLFINGCFLPHPTRYRVSHQIEQLFAGGLVAQRIDYTELEIELVRQYRAFVFFRCPYTDTVGEFIRKAKELNKLVVFDIDDLMFDVEYTKSISYIDSMDEKAKDEYYDGINLNRKTLELCDYAITTTECLADELKKYVSEVYINRNVASEEMYKLSELALKKRESKEENNKVIAGYFSGSITHNQDFEMILPSIVKCMSKFDNFYLSIVGELDIPKELETYKDRIIVNSFVDWTELPELVASVDINLAPLCDTLFNKAKSENKWTEASLVKVVTIASNVGAFQKVINDGETGVLCNSEEWVEKLSKVISDKEYRSQIAFNAYKYVKENYITTYSAYGVCDWFRKHFTPNYVFVLPVLQISGGALVTLKHCEILSRKGYDVSIINEGKEKDKWVTKDGVNIPVLNKYEYLELLSIDNAVGTLWSTMDFVISYANIKRRKYLVQNFETDFYKPNEFFKFRANQSYYFRDKVDYLTISKWCYDWLKEKYKTESKFAPNGIYCERFKATKRNFNTNKIRILIEGNSDDYYKNVEESFRIVDLLDKEKYEIWYMSYQGEPKKGYYVDKFLHKIPYEEVPDIYRQCHILLKTSILESFSYPPLEMMATGGMVVVVPNDGNVEYLVGGENCLTYNQGNLEEAVKCIECICSNEELREKLYQNGVETALKRDWTTIEKNILTLYE